MAREQATLEVPWFERLGGGMGARAREFQHMVFAPSALDGKSKELIAVAVSSFQRCAHCTKGHVARAKRLGASPEEISEALVMASLLVSGTQMNWLKNAFEETLGHEGDDRAYYLGQTNGMGEAWQRFHQAVYEPSAIDLKTKELLAVALASLGRCEHCTRTHLRKAGEAGADKREIAEALMVSASVASATELHWLLEDFGEIGL